MSLRERARGSLTNFYSGSPDGCRFEARRQYFPTRDEFRTVPVPVGVTLPTSDNEQINDVPDRPGCFNPCHHVRSYPFYVTTRLASCRSSLDPNQYYGTDWFWVGHDLGTAVTKVSVESFNGGNSPDLPSFGSIDWGSLVSRVGDKLDGSMTASTNILVEIAQLAQTLEMLKNPFRLRTQNFARRYKTLRHAIKDGADIWLEGRYGWMNFVRDLTNVSVVFAQVRQHVKYLRDTCGSWSSLAERQVDEAPYTLLYPVQGVYVNNLRLTISNLVARRTAAFSLDILRGEGFRLMSEMDLVLQRLGTDDILAALWDLVPFSFVVDWFINIQEFVTRSPIYWNSFTLKRLGYSIRTELFADLTVESRATGYGNDHTDSLSRVPNQRVYKVYDRCEGFPPNTDTVGVFGGLSLTHIADGAALIAQRLL